MVNRFIPVLVLIFTSLTQGFIFCGILFIYADKPIQKEPFKPEKMINFVSVYFFVLMSICFYLERDLMKSSAVLIISIEGN